MRTVFDTSGIEARLRWDAWQEAICSIYAKVDVRNKPEKYYSGTVHLGNFGPITITDTDVSESMVCRESGHISSCSNDNIFVQIVKSGRGDVSQGDDWIRNTVGRAVVFSVAKPYRLQYRSAVSSMYIEIDRKKLQSEIKDEGLYKFRCIDITVGIGKVFHDLCFSAIENSSTFTRNEQDRVGQQIFDLFVLAISRQDQTSDYMQNAAIADARRQSIERYIRHNFHRAVLSPAAVARANGISTRYLHRLFEERGQSVAQQIWKMRLERSLELMRSHSHRHLSITDIAFECGFNSSSHFSNFVRRETGESPSAIREQAFELQGSS